MAAGLLILQTPLVKLDQQAFHAVDSLGLWPPIIFEILDPHTRNYTMIVLLGLVLAFAVRRRAAIAMVAMFVLADVIAGAMLLMTKPVFDRARPEKCSTWRRPAARGAISSPSPAATWSSPLRS